MSQTTAIFLAPVNGYNLLLLVFWTLPKGQARVAQELIDPAHIRHNGNQDTRFTMTVSNFVTVFFLCRREIGLFQEGSVVVRSPSGSFVTTTMADWAPNAIQTLTHIAGYERD